MVSVEVSTAGGVEAGGFVTGGVVGVLAAPTMIVLNTSVALFPAESVAL